MSVRQNLHVFIYTKQNLIVHHDLKIISTINIDEVSDFNFSWTNNISDQLFSKHRFENIKNNW